MDPSGGLSVGHALYAVGAGLVLHSGVCALALDHDFSFLDSADISLVGIDDLITTLRADRELCTLILLLPLQHLDALFGFVQALTVVVPK